MTEEARYGELTVETYSWDAQDWENNKLDYDFCTEEQLGFVQGPETMAFPIYDLALGELTSYKNKFKCAKREQLSIWGDYSSAKAQ